MRYINLGFEDAAHQMAHLEMADFLKDEFLLVLERPDTEVLIYLGTEPLDKMVHADKLGGIGKCRINFGVSSPGIFHSRDSISGTLIYPFTEKQRLPKREVLLIKDIVVETLQEMGIECVPPDDGTPHKNDLFLDIDGRAKKFFSVMSKVQNTMRVVVFAMTFKFHLEKAREIFRLDIGKFTKKKDIGDTGRVEDIGDIVCGLHEVKPDVDIDEFRRLWAEKIAEKFGWKLEVSKFTKTEQKKLDDLAVRLDTKEWTEDGKFPEIQRG